jgi:hypothetical protein
MSGPYLPYHFWTEIEVFIERKLPNLESLSNCEQIPLTDIRALNKKQIFIL